MKAVAALVLAGAICLAQGCKPSRLGSCKTDSDCGDGGAGSLVCFSLRCVECQYDSDCDGRGAGLVCNRSTNVCETTAGGAPPELPAAKGSKDAGADAPAAAEPSKGSLLPEPAAGPSEDAGEGWYLRQQGGAPKKK